MGVLTSFILVEPDFAKLGPEELAGGPLEWMTFGSGLSEDFGLPANYVTRRFGIDKSWDEWAGVLWAIGLLGVQNTLFDFPEDIEDPWGIWTRYVSVSETEEEGLVDDVKYIRTRLWPFETEAAIAAAVNAKLTDYDGELMDADDVSDVVSNIAAFAKWLHESYKEGDYLVIQTS